MKKKFGLVFMAFVLLIVANIVNVGFVDAGTSNYKVTKYKSYAAVQKHYSRNSMTLTKECGFSFQKVRTKFGKKKVMYVYSPGCDASATKMGVYIKHGNKIYKIQDFVGYPEGISKDGKYLYVSQGSIGSEICVYKNGIYKQLKFIQDPKPKQTENLKKKYKIRGDFKYLRK